MTAGRTLLAMLGAALCLSCTEYTPKPRGDFRIEPPAPRYVNLPTEAGLPYTFRLSTLATVELPPAGDPAGWINLSYPSLDAKLYCSFLRVAPEALAGAMRDSRELTARQAGAARAISEQAYSDPGRRVYASLFLLDGGSAAPVQLAITDSVGRFFRGSLLYNVSVRADSVAPVTEYLRRDVVELVQTFRWID